MSAELRVAHIFIVEREGERERRFFLERPSRESVLENGEIVDTLIMIVNIAILSLCKKK